MDIMLIEWNDFLKAALFCLHGLSGMSMPLRSDGGWAMSENSYTVLSFLGKTNTVSYPLKWSIHVEEADTAGTGFSGTKLHLRRLPELPSSWPPAAPFQQFDYPVSPSGTLAPLTVTNRELMANSPLLDLPPNCKHAFWLCISLYQSLPGRCSGIGVPRSLLLFACGTHKLFSWIL